MRDTEPVIARIAVKRVGPGDADQHVIARATMQQIVIRSAETVGVRIAREEIVAIATREAVVAEPADQRVTARFAQHRVVAAERAQIVIAIPGQEQIRLRTALERVAPLGPAARSR